MRPAALGPSWLPGPAEPRAATNRVDVWCVATGNDPAGLRAAEQSLSAQERARAGRMRVGGERFAMARAALRELLGRYLGITPAELCFVTGDHGKPALSPAQGSALRFSIARSGDLALIAVRLGIDLGVDIEQVRHDVDADAVADTAFTARERAAWTRPPGARTGNGFFGAWTRHESVAKALGSGITSPLPETVANDFAVRELSGIAGHAAAVASRGQDWTVTCAWIPQGVSPRQEACSEASALDRSTCRA